MALKCRGMGKARKFSEGGTPNATQRAVGPTIFQDTERRRRAAMDMDEVGSMQQAPRATGGSPPIKRRVVDAKTKAKQDAQLKAMLKKHDAPLD